MRLLQNDIFLLLLIVILGEAIGRLRVKDFSLGSSAIIFVALAFGHFGHTLPETFQTLGLVLFIYSIGLQAGPGFGSSFRAQGLRLSLGALTIVALGWVTTLAAAWLAGFDPATAAGVFAGSLTSTPGLAVAVEASRSSAASTAYGLTYTFGVLGVILFVKLLPRVMRVEVSREEEEIQREVLADTPPLGFRHLQVVNPSLFGKAIRELHLRAIAPVVITRLLSEGATEPVLVSGDTRLREGDLLRVVGREQDLDRIELVIGRRVEAPIEFARALEKRTLVVSKKEAVGQTIASLSLRDVFNVQVSRIERNGIELPPSPRTRLHLGDVLHCVGDGRSVRNVARLLGNDLRATYTVRLLPLFVGLLAGFLMGQVPLYFPFAGEFKLGTTGGVLLSGLLLSRLYMTGPLIWELPSTANNFIRDLGLVLFLAAVGTSAGSTLLATLQAQGASLILAGVAVTLVPLIGAALILPRLLGLRFLRMLGVITGGMTSTPGLAATTSISETPHAAAAYATVYPVALIAMILSTRLLVLVLSGG